MSKIIDENKEYVVKGILLVALIDVVNILNTLNAKEKFENDILLYNLGMLNGIFKSESNNIHEIKGR